MKKNMSQDIAKLGFHLLPCITLYHEYGAIKKDWQLINLKKPTMLWSLRLSFTNKSKTKRIQFN